MDPRRLRLFRCRPKNGGHQRGAQQEGVHCEQRLASIKEKMWESATDLQPA